MANRLQPAPPYRRRDSSPDCLSGAGPIPLEMFETGAGIIEEVVGLLLEETGQADSPQTVRDGLTELAAYSLLSKDGETGTVHRMVQEVVRRQIPEERRR